MLKTENQKTKTTTKKASASGATTRKKGASASSAKKSGSPTGAIPVAATSPAASAFRPYPSREDIARRAYELYQARGGRGGSATEDWLRAEQELANGKGRTRDAAPPKR